MLVISRRLGDKVVINNGQVWITVVALTQNRVEIGFDAPREIDVDREEIYLRKMAEAQRRGAKTNETQENKARRVVVDVRRTPTEPQELAAGRLVSEMRRPQEPQRAAPRIEYRRRRRS